MTLKQKLKKEGYSIYKLASLTTKTGTSEHKRVSKNLERILSGIEMTAEKKKEFLDYFRRVKLEHLIDDDDFKIVKIIKYKVK